MVEPELAFADLNDITNGQFGAALRFAIDRDAGQPEQIFGAAQRRVQHLEGLVDAGRLLHRNRPLALRPTGEAVRMEAVLERKVALLQVLPVQFEGWIQLEARKMIDLAGRLTDAELSEIVEFAFVGGSQGAMTRMQIILHVVNHATYHRGFVSDMLYQVPVKPVANDLPVFLRDVWNRA